MLSSVINNFNSNYAYWILIAVIIGLAAVIGFGLSYREGLEPMKEESVQEEEQHQEGSVQEEEQEHQEEVPEELHQEMNKIKGPVLDETDQEYADYNLKSGVNTIRPEDLLPKTDDVKDFENNFSPNKMNRNFLTAGHHIGVNTVSSSLKNANLSIRSDPVIPRVDVGPWNSSTILPSDVINRKPFEIGSAGSS